MSSLSLVYPPAIGGRAALRFNGIEDGVNGDYLHGTGNVSVSDAMTAFAVYDAFNTTNSFNSVWCIVGVPGTVYGASRGYTIDHGMMDFTATMGLRFPHDLGSSHEYLPHLHGQGAESPI